MDITLNFSKKYLNDPLGKWTVLDRHFNLVMEGKIMEESLSIYIGDHNDVYVVITASDASLWNVEHFTKQGKFVIDPK